MPGQKAERDLRRAQILRAGNQVASRLGLDGLTMRLVAAKARLSSGLVHFYFKTKERLLAALLVDVLNPALAPADARDAVRIKRPLGHLWSLLRREIKGLSGQPGRLRLFFEYWVKGFRNPKIRAQMREEYRRKREVFRPAAEAVLAADPDRFPNVSPAGLAAVAAGVVEGAAVQAVTDPRKFDVDEYLTAAKGLLEGAAPGVVPDPPTPRVA